jgi:NADH-quinone oxidoreductase subunit C/D
MSAVLTNNIVDTLQEKFGRDVVIPEDSKDKIPTFWMPRERVRDILAFLKSGIEQPYEMLYDLTAIDERARKIPKPDPASDFTAVYHLLSFDRNAYLRTKVALREDALSLDTITSIWPSANWYEREVWDMFGVTFSGHPHLHRLIMPDTWTGHPLQKNHPARATEIGPFTLPPEKEDAEQESLRFRPEDFGMQRVREDADLMFLNVGPQHPGTHGVLRIVLQLDGEEIIDAVPLIGFHHRGAEKMGERQSWHTYIPYTDRVDYLGGVMNNLAYLTALEKLGGIHVPPRAQVIRVMLSELFRIISHLVWYGTYAQDVGQMSPVFYTFNDRERAFEIIEAICGARMHPNWFRIGGVAQDLPKGWDNLIRAFIKYLPPRLAEYDRTVLRNRIFKARTVGVGAFTTEEAIEWGATGPNLRACGMDWDFRKKQPYSGYEHFEFDIPTGVHGDCYDRSLVRVEEMRQSLRIIEQCVNNMPGGPYQSDNPLATPPLKDRTMHDIETLITHFLNVSWGPVIPAGEALGAIEATKGNNGYYLVSDGNTVSYRTRIRTPSFAHLQMLPLLCRGRMIPDLLAVLGAMDYVLADVDR